MGHARLEPKRMLWRSSTGPLLHSLTGGQTRRFSFLFCIERSDHSEWPGWTPTQVMWALKTGEKYEYDGDSFGCKRYIGCKGAAWAAKGPLVPSSLSLYNLSLSLYLSLCVAELYQSQRGEEKEGCGLDQPVDTSAKRTGRLAPPEGQWSTSKTFFRFILLFVCVHRRCISGSRAPRLNHQVPGAWCL